MEGAAQVADPGVGVFPGDEVAAVVVGVDVDVVEPIGLRAGRERRTRSSAVWMPGGFS